MALPLKNYLRTARKRAGFTQDEVAFLLGSKSGTKVSRYERFSRDPNPKTVFACEIIFRTPARKLFAGVFHDVEQRVQKRAKLLAKRLAREEIDSTTARKIEILLAICSR